MNIPKTNTSKNTDVTGAGYEFVAQDRQNSGTMDEYLSKKHGREKKYLDFVLNPDIESPIRMPSDFTYPTNLLSWKQNVQLTIGAPGDFVGYFCPQNPILAPQASYPPTISAAYASYIFCARNNTTLNYQANIYSSLASSAPAVANVAVDPNQVFPYYTQFDSVRVIGGVCKFEYIGSLQNTSGMITVAADLVAQNSTAVGQQLPPTNSQLYNLLVYKKFNASEQTRSVWFPVDASCTNFLNVNPNRVQNTVADLSVLIFYFNGYGLPPGSMLDLTIEIYYEAVPNLQFTNLFVASQGTSKEKSSSAWSEILSFGKQNLGQVLITGAKAAINWATGGISGLVSKLVS